MPLIAPRAQVLMATVGHRELKWPGSYSTVLVRPRSNFFCDFHNEYGHTTEECRHLRNEIERMVRKGWLQNWVKQEHELRPGTDRSPDRRDRPAEGKHGHSSAKPAPSRGTIHMIVGGPTDGDSNLARKAYARSSGEVLSIGGKREGSEISFGPKDEQVSIAHNDAMVITTTIANYEVARAMVDTGSSVNVLFHEAYLRMELEMEIKPVETALFGFGGGMVEPLGQVTLPMSLGDLPMQKTRMVTFLVVDSYSTYNVIIGRPAINSFQAIVSTFHMKLKFVVGDGIGEVWGNAQVARKCYVEAVRKGEQRKSKRKVVEIDKESKPIKIGKKEKKKDPDLLSVRPEEELMTIELTPGDPSKVVKIGTKLGSELIKESAIIAYPDAMLVTNQVGRNFDIKEDRMRRYVGVVAELVKKFDKFELLQVPRGENTKADHLSKVASSAQESESRNITVLTDSLPSIGAEITEIGEGDDWRADLHKYLSTNDLPEDKRKVDWISESQIKSFIWKNLVSKYGWPRDLISDNGARPGGEDRNVAELSSYHLRSLEEILSPRVKQAQTPEWPSSARTISGPLGKLYLRGLNKLKALSGRAQLVPSQVPWGNSISRVKQAQTPGGRARLMHHLRSLWETLSPRVKQAQTPEWPSSARTISGPLGKFYLRGLNKLKPLSGRARLVPSQVPWGNSNHPGASQIP
ncbi:hypothetical protein DH2020_039589 [Rehmannia glutinosa]|uniref:RNase H type-1 domain-containing protein n=1 Tax=Rehmannia glutinosa TaxID=99300 RepID=A0ABR0UY58_REHGL